MSLIYIFSLLFFIAYFDQLVKYTARFLLYIFGFKIKEDILSELPNKCVMIPPSHTSNIDGIIVLLVYFGYGDDKVNPLIMIKKELKSVFGSFGEKYFKFLYIDRQQGGVVKDTIEKLKGKSSYALLIAPEGTRKLTTGMRSGFWHIANELDVEICMMCFCYKRKTLDKIFKIKPTNIENDFKKIENEAIKYMPFYKEHSYLHAK